MHGKHIPCESVLARERQEGRRTAQQCACSLCPPPPPHCHPSFSPALVANAAAHSHDPRRLLEYSLAYPQQQPQHGGRLDAKQCVPIRIGNWLAGSHLPSASREGEGGGGGGRGGGGGGGGRTGGRPVADSSHSSQTASRHWSATGVYPPPPSVAPQLYPPFLYDPHYREGEPHRCTEHKPGDESGDEDEDVEKVEREIPTKRHRCIHCGRKEEEEVKQGKKKKKKEKKARRRNGSPSGKRSGSETGEGGRALFPLFWKICLFALFCLFVHHLLSLAQGSRPSVQVDDFHLHSIAAHRRWEPGKLRPRVLLDLSFDVVFAIENPNWVGLGFANLSSVIIYREREIAKVTAPGGSVCGGCRRLLHSRVNVTDVRMLEVGPQLLVDMARGHVLIVIKAQIHGRIEILSWKHPLQDREGIGRAFLYEDEGGKGEGVKSGAEQDQDSHEEREKEARRKGDGKQLWVKGRRREGEDGLGCSGRRGKLT
ncbi:hypothetical protein CBR_g40418 [Chara braunii]|uniref:Late embryogenesis abundant protein LEA-2 subgroup domain-containing protein n=1 Tax=Chara braunii TaxID=69332 RepID=A0A388LTP3_CHABU|nr:hypothetical protein CBR_g40418 [Chara braunii]|eukprot:GBG85686.1 hypothetical protein CBR_g40418 [Chara braunii]